VEERPDAINSEYIVSRVEKITQTIRLEAMKSIVCTQGLGAREQGSCDGGPKARDVKRLAKGSQSRNRGLSIIVDIPSKRVYIQYVRRRRRGDVNATWLTSVS
jgi:hypothetical protein